MSREMKIQLSTPGHLAPSLSRSLSRQGQPLPQSMREMFVVREIEDLVRTLIRHQHDHAPVRDLNLETDRRLGRGQRTAADLARLVGSWTFVSLQAVLTVCWLVLNVFAATQHWDPYPFLLLNLVVSLECALWTVLVLMSLNSAADRDRLRAQQEYEVAVKAEEEMRAVMEHLEAQDEVMLQILQRLERSDRAVRRMGRRLGIPEDASG
jgi:uncharacterized membrane protein